MLTIKKLIFESDEPPKVLTLEDVFESFQVTHPGILEQVSEIDTRIPSGQERMEVNLVEFDKLYSLTLLLNQKEGAYDVGILELVKEGEKLDPLHHFNSVESFSTFIARYESLEFLKDKIVDFVAESFRLATLKEKLVSSSQLNIEKEVELLYKSAFESKGFENLSFGKTNKAAYNEYRISGTHKNIKFNLYFDISESKDMIYPRLEIISKEQRIVKNLPVIYIIYRFNGNMEDVVNHLANLVSKKF